MGLTDLARSFMPARVKVGKKCDYGLTELGKVKAEEFEDAGSSKWQVLNYMNDHGASSLREICEGLHIHEDAAKEIINQLINKYGYVRRVPR